MSKYKTPLRYPGGKQKLWPFLLEILEANGLDGGEYVEPYSGGAGVAMELLLRGHVSKVHLNDSCPAVSAFWHSILNETEKFCRKISRASLTVEEWKKQREVFRSRETADRFDLGYAFFFLNRCNRSGILNGGLIGGLKQEGRWKLDARFTRNDLISRVEEIGGKRTAIRIRNWDAEKYLKTYVPRLPRNTLVYCDPPYYKKADRLYPNYYSHSDHEQLARVIQRDVKVPWVVSYDSCEEVAANFEYRVQIEYKLQYNAAKAYKGSELFVFSDDLYLPYSSRIPSINEVLELIP